MRHMTAVLLLLVCGAVWSADGAAEVIKLQRAGTSEDVQLAFVRNSSVAYDLSADDIDELERAGVSASVIVAMLDHGKELPGDSSVAATAEAAPGASSE